jgi:tRNA-modifying protein YgfZ
MDGNCYRALRETAAWIDLSARGRIRATGDDRTRLLHAMCTNHIQNLQPGGGCYAFFLTAQGRILADANVFCMPDYLLLDTEPESRQRLFEHLDKFIIADDVLLHDFTGQYSVLSVEGPGSVDLLEHLGFPTAHCPWTIAEAGHMEITHVTYTGGPGYMISLAAEHRDELIRKLAAKGVLEADLATADVVRIENGRPRYGVDIQETTLPQETQLAYAVHASKGCYIGQEIVERVRSRGHVNKLLSAFDIQGSEAPAAGTAVHSDGKEVGSITSAAFSPARGCAVAMGFVRAEAMKGPLTVAGAAASVRPPAPIAVQ